MSRALSVLAALAAVAAAYVIAFAAANAFKYPVGSLAQSAPRRTAMMLEREAEARTHVRRYPMDQRWIPYASVSPLLRRAILVAEDDAFYQHGGLDWNEIKASARVDLERRSIVRGGSTITQQLAKNLFLGDRRTITRKVEEVFLALRLERALTKRRIFELYLNLIEWGDGIFGAEAAAQHYFHVSASRLDERQAVLLAAIIINPRRFSPLDPPHRIERRVRLIASRLRRRGFLSEEQYRAITGEPAEVAPSIEKFAPAETARATPREDTSGSAAPGRPDSTAFLAR